MTGYIGLIGLLGIASFIVLLFIRRRRIENKLRAFYQKHSLFAVVPNETPANVREALGAANLSCRRGSLKPAASSSGKEVEFYWWEWLVSSTIYAGSAPQTSVDYFLAVSFSPNVLSGDFERLVKDRLQENADFSQKVKNAFVLNTDAPARIEKTADGSFVIIWRIIRKAEALEEKIAWLQNNLSSAECSVSPVET